MKGTFTTLDLIAFLYDETDVRTSYLISESLSDDWREHEEYRELEKMKLKLDELKFQPSKQSIQNIMFEARA